MISTVSFIGGRNPFLGIAYIAVGGVCVLLGLALTLRHLIKPRKLGDPQVSQSLIPPVLFRPFADPFFLLVSCSLTRAVSVVEPACDALNPPIHGPRSVVCVVFASLSLSWSTPSSFFPRPLRALMQQPVCTTYARDLERDLEGMARRNKGWAQARKKGFGLSAVVTRRGMCSPRPAAKLPPRLSFPQVSVVIHTSIYSFEQAFRRADMRESKKSHRNDALPDEGQNRPRLQPLARGAMIHT